VKRLFQSAALLLLALWLPATLHCDLEAAELWVEHDDHAADSCCQASGQGCAKDTCDTLEGSAVRTSDTFTRAPLPVPFVCLCLIDILPVEAESLVSPVPIQTRMEQALAWVPSVHFARRAAPLSRAPSSLGC